MTTVERIVLPPRPPDPADVLLADGRLGVVRPLRPEDEDAIRSLHERMSDDNLRLRFFNVSRKAARDYVAHVLVEPSVLALVAEVEQGVVGLSTAEPTGPGVAEVSVLVADDFHGCGVGTLLLEHLAAFARDRGIWRFEADVLADNHLMLTVMADAKMEVGRHPDRGVVTVSMTTASTPAFQDAADQREFVAQQRSLAPLLAPGSVGVAGVRGDGTGVGAAVLRSIVAGGFRGELFVVHPRRHTVGDIVACRSFGELPVTVDLAIIAVPAEAAEEALIDAAGAGVPAAVVISSGFGELGAHGAELQARLARLARERGLRLVGPNCLGVLVNDPAVRLNATFHAQRPPAAGGLTVASQSGGVGIVLLDRAARLGLGVRSFVSLGNAADVSSNDLLAAWYLDPQVTAAALYLESFGNARKFARFARRFSERKPLLAVVGGSSASGRRGGLSHTAAAASSAAAVRALFAQAGVVGCVDADDLAETALLLTGQPLPRGPRVGVLSNAGGMGILVADAAEAAGLRVPELSADLRARLSRHVLGTDGTTNPVDAGAAVSPEDMGQVLEHLLASGEVDAMVVVVVATGVTDGAAVVQRLVRARRAAPELPVLLVTLGGLKAGETPGLTRHSSTTAAVRALGHAVDYARWRSVPAESSPVTDPEVVQAVRTTAAQLLAARVDEDCWLDVAEAGRLLAPYGLDILGEVASGADEAAAVASRVGFPVVVKLATAGAGHKTEAGLVQTDLASPDDVRRAVSAIGRVTETTPKVLVQPMVPGVEIALGVVRDPTMGPLVMVAAGGVATDVLDDRAFLLPPVTPADAGRALRGLRLWPLLDGFRGTAPADVGALEHAIVALARFAADVPEVAELDVNPVMARPDGCALVDVRMRLAVAEEPGLSARQLRRTW